MQTPKKFRLGKKTINVRVVPMLDKPPGAMGALDTHTNVITLATSSNLTQRVYKQEERDDTFWHEVTHAILKDMNSTLWDNETFVTQFSNRLTQVINTAKF